MPAKPKHLAADHPVRKLFLELQSWKKYPDGVLKVPELILGTSFFPGGVGLWCEGREKVPELPVGEIMVLGHNFDAASSYYTSLSNCTENINVGTWGQLRPVLRKADVQMEDCFFTNVYMGLKEGDDPTGEFVPPGNDDFVERCRSFFIEQIECQRPRAILALGREVPIFLAPLSAQLLAWHRFKSFREIDRAGRQVVRNVSFEAIPDHKCNIVCLVHPSWRHRNAKLRRWGELKGDAAEIQMIQEACRRLRHSDHPIADS